MTSVYAHEYERSLRDPASFAELRDEVARVAGTIRARAALLGIGYAVKRGSHAS